MEVDRTLQPRLLAWFEADLARAALLQRTREKLAAPMEALVGAADSASIGVTHIGGALSVLDAAAGLRLWGGVERRVAREGNWSWARRVTALLLGEEGAVGPDHGPLSAAVRATHTSALLHEGASVDLVPHWTAVKRSAELCPDPEVGVRLTSRARLGRVAAAVRAGQEPSMDDVREFMRLLTREAGEEGGAGARGGAPEQGGPEEGDPAPGPTPSDPWEADQEAARVIAVVEALLEAERPLPPSLLHAWAERLAGAGVDPLLQAVARS